MTGFYDERNTVIDVFLQILNKRIYLHIYLFVIYSLVNLRYCFKLKNPNYGAVNFRHFKTGTCIQ